MIGLAENSRGKHVPTSGGLIATPPRDPLLQLLMEDIMTDRPVFTHEARCFAILAGGVLERCIEGRARRIAASRSASEIVPEDVERATKEFLEEELSSLPHLIEQAIERYKHQSTKAA